MRLILSFLPLIFLCVALRSEETPAPLSCSDLLRDIETVVVGEAKPDTDLKRDAAVKRMCGKIAVLAEKKTISFDTTIENVHGFKDGVVRMRLARPVADNDKTRHYSAPWTADFLVRIPTEIAEHINKGDRVTVSGALVYYPEAWGAVGISHHQQQLWSIKPTEFPFLGTFVLSSFSMTLGAQKFVGVLP